MRIHGVAPCTRRRLCHCQCHRARKTELEGTQVGCRWATWIKESGWSWRRRTHNSSAVNTQWIVCNNIAGLDPRNGSNTCTKIPWLNYFDSFDVPSGEHAKRSIFSSRGQNSTLLWGETKSFTRLQKARISLSVDNSQYFSTICKLFFFVLMLLFAALDKTRWCAHTLKCLINLIFSRSSETENNIFEHFDLTYATQFWTQVFSSFARTETFLVLWFLLLFFLTDYKIHSIIYFLTSSEVTENTQRNSDRQ